MLQPARLKEIQTLIRRMPVPESVVEAILTLVRSARPGQGNAETDKHVAWGPGPRASQALMLCARARALYDGRLAPSVDDVRALAEPVLQHRMALTFAARAEGMTVRDVVAKLVKGDLMARIGEVQAPAATRDALARGRLRASLVPDLLVEARRIVNTVIAGWHGRRKRGIGENFWQFRPYVEGECLAHRLAPLGPRRPHLCARPRMGSRPYGLALGRPLAVDALQIDRRQRLQGVARAGAGAGPGRTAVAQRRAHRLARPDRSVHRPQRRRAPRRAADRMPATCRPSPTCPASAASATSSSSAISSIRSTKPWPGSTCSPATACAPI